MSHAAGLQVKGILESADLQTAAPFVLYDINQTVVTMAANEILVIYLISITNGDTAAIVDVFDDKDGDGAVDAGEPLYSGSLAAKQQAGWALVRGHAVKRLPKVKASAASANTKCLILGEVQRANIAL